MAPPENEKSAWTKLSVCLPSWTRLDGIDGRLRPSGWQRSTRFRGGRSIGMYRPSLASARGSRARQDRLCFAPGLLSAAADVQCRRAGGARAWRAMGAEPAGRGSFRRRNKCTWKNCHCVARRSARSNSRYCALGCDRPNLAIAGLANVARSLPRCGRTSGRPRMAADWFGGWRCQVFGCADLDSRPSPQVLSVHDLHRHRLKIEIVEQPRVDADLWDC